MDLQGAALLPLRTLYHYTTQAGLLGILDSKEIWASEIQYLNDATEFRNGLDVVGAELRKRLDELDSREGGIRGEGLFRELTTLDEIDVDVFVLSLTENGDDLSQWRAYGGKHSGFALGFDIERLCQLASEHQFSLDRCLYESPEQGLLAATIVDSALAWISAGDRMTSRRRREFRRAMIKTAPLLKHYSFGEEREWRLVHASHAVNPAKVAFRSGPSTIIPYYKLSLCGASGSSPLCSVTVGPTPHGDLALRSVSALLSARGFKGVTVHQSEIPLRTW